MREGVSKQVKKESGTKEGSVSSFIHEAHIKASGVKNAMEGIGGAAEIAKTVEDLGALGEKFPEFRHWVSRKLSQVEAFSKKAKGGKELPQEFDKWKEETKDALADWNATREDTMFYDSRRARVEIIGLLREAVKSMRNRKGKGGEVFMGEELKEVKSKDSKTLEFIEDGILLESDDINKEKEILRQIKELCDVYGIEFPLKLEAELTGMNAGNYVRAEIARGKRVKAENEEESQEEILRRIDDRNTGIGDIRKNI